MAEVTDWKKLTIPLLKQELANRSLEVKGRKSDLVSRLEQSDHTLEGVPGSAEVDNENGDQNTTGEDVSDGGDDLEMMSREENEEEGKGEGEEEDEKLDEQEDDMDDCLLEEGNSEEGDMGELLLEEGTTEESLLEEDGAKVSQSEERNTGLSSHAEYTDGQKEESFEKKDAEQDLSPEMENMDEVKNDDFVEREIVEGEQKEGESSGKEVVDVDDKDESLDGDDVIDMDLDEKEEEEREAEEGGEKKKETLKRFDLATLYIPKVDEIHKDLQVSQKFRVLYIYPLRTEMMGDPAVMVHFQHSSSMPCKFYPTDTPEGKVYEGYLILRFEFSEDALVAMEGLREVLPDSVNVHVRQPSQTHKDMLSAFNRSEPQGIEPWIKDNKNTKVVFVGNLPPTATEAALKEIFTDATIIRIAREDDSSSKGYAIVGYDNEKVAEHAAKEHMCAIIDNYVLAVLYLSQANNRSAVDKEFYVDRTKLLEELKKFEEEIGLSSREKKKLKGAPGQIKKAPQRKASPALKKPAGPTQRKVVKKEAAAAKVKKDTPTSKASKETEKNGEVTSTEGLDAEKKSRERVRRSRWSNEGDKNRPQPQVLEKLQQLQKKWERPPERQRDQRRSGDTRPRRSWNSQRSSGDNKRSYPFRPDRDDKRYRMGRSPDSGRMTNFNKPRMQSSLDTVYQQGAGMAMAGGPAVGVGMAQGGGMGMAGGMGMVGGMGMGGGMAQGGGMVMGAGMGMGMGGVLGQAGGMTVGGGMAMGSGMGAVPSLLSAGQVGQIGGHQPMMQSNVMGMGTGGGMGRGPGVNLLLGLTQILSKQLSNQPQGRRRDRVRPRSHSDTRR